MTQTELTNIGKTGVKTLALMLSALFKAPESESVLSLTCCNTPAMLRVV